MNQLIDFLGLGEASGASLSEATYFACMKVLSEAIGKLPLKLLKYNNNNGVVTAKDHPLYMVLKDRPNPYMTSTNFWSTVEFNRNHYGNTYVLITGAGKRTELWILPSDKIEIVYDDARLLRDNPDIYYVYQLGMTTYTFSSEEILHFKASNTLDGITGFSVREQLK